MIVYHGSNSRFDTLRISKTLVKHNSTLLNEGLGIYFSLDRSVAESYGKYLYTLEVNDDKLFDMRLTRVVQSRIKWIIKEILKSTGIDISYYIEIKNLAKYVVDGRIAIDNICHEIYLLLDSQEGWYMNNNNTEINKVYRKLNQLNKVKVPAYLFNYNIKGVGVIKVVTPDIVKIISREKIN